MQNQHNTKENHAESKCQSYTYPYILWFMVFWWPVGLLLSFDKQKDLIFLR